MKKRRRTTEDYVLDFVIYAILIALTLVCLLPVWHIVMASFSNSTDIAMTEGLMFWPKKIDLGGFKLVFQDDRLMSGFKNTLIILGASLPLNIVMTLLCAYFMSCTNMKLKKPFMIMLMITMFFGGGLIPSYLNNKNLGLVDTMWVLILPGAMTTYNAMICRTSIEAIPESLKESAYLDGANDIQIIFKIILPLIKATIAVITLYYGVSHWNAWFDASIYIKTPEKLPLQNIMRSILIVNTNPDEVLAIDTYNSYAETIKYAAIVFSTVPIMCVYPFLQKYFTKGALIGAVKG